MILLERRPAASHGALLDAVIRARAGDPLAFSDLVRRHERGIYNVVLGIVRDPEDALDLTQDVWLRVTRSLNTLHDPALFTAWLYRIARNSSLNFLRSRRRHDDARASHDDAQDIESTLPASTSEQPEACLLAMDERGKIWHALGALSEQDRTALFLREHEQLPYAEISIVLGITPHAAEVRVSRARQRFREHFLRIDADTSAACGITPFELSALVAGELAEESGVTLERHLSRCDGCRTRLERMETGHRLYRALGVFALPTAVTATSLGPLVATATAPAVVTGAAVAASASAAGGAAGIFGSLVAATIALFTMTSAVLDDINAAQPAPVVAVPFEWPDLETYLAVDLQPLPRTARILAESTAPGGSTHEDAPTSLVGLSAPVSGEIPVMEPESPVPAEVGAPMTPATSPAVARVVAGSRWPHNAAGEMPGKSGAAQGKAGDAPGQAGASHGRAGDPPGHSDTTTGPPAHAHGATALGHSRDESPPGAAVAAAARERGGPPEGVGAGLGRGSGSEGHGRSTEAPGRATALLASTDEAATP